MNICTKLGFTRPLSALISRLKCVGIITMSNLTLVLEVAERLKTNPVFLEIALELTERCIKLARFNLISVNALNLFIIENKSRKEQVLQVVEQLKRSVMQTMSWKWSKDYWESGLNEYGFKGMDELGLFFMSNRLWSFESCVGRNGTTGLTIRLQPMKYLKNQRNVKIFWKCVFIKNGEKQMQESISFEKNNFRQWIVIEPEKLRECDEIEVHVTVKLRRILPKPFYPFERKYEPPLFWFDKETIYLDADIESFERDKVVVNPSCDSGDEPSVLLKCQGSFLSAKKCVLMEESSYFNAKFGRFDTTLEGVYRMEKLFPE